MEKKFGGRIQLKRADRNYALRPDLAPPLPPPNTLRQGHKGTGATSHGSQLG